MYFYTINRLFTSYIILKYHLLKLQKIILSFAIAILSISSYGQAKSTYTFSKVEKKNMKNNVVIGQQSIGKDCTLIIDQKKNLYTFSYQSTDNAIDFQVTFKVTGNTAEVVGDDAPQKTIYTVVSSLDNKGAIRFVPKPNNNNAFVYSFLSTTE